MFSPSILYNALLVRTKPLCAYVALGNWLSWGFPSTGLWPSSFPPLLRQIRKPENLDSLDAAGEHSLYNIFRVAVYAALLVSTGHIWGCSNQVSQILVTLAPFSPLLPDVPCLSSDLVQTLSL